MYNAFASTFDETHAGSTRLHLDMSDAVNLLVHATNASDGSAGYALWHIFAPEDTCHIRSQSQRPSDSAHPSPFVAAWDLSVASLFSSFMTHLPLADSLVLQYDTVIDLDRPLQAPFARSSRPHIERAGHVCSRGRIDSYSRLFPDPAAMYYVSHR